MMALAGWLLWLATTLAIAQEYPPPPPPPPPPKAEPAPPPSRPEKGSALDRYDQCFQKMVDQGVTDNTFMRKCLGIPLRSEPTKSPSGKPLYLDEHAVEQVFKHKRADLQKCLTPFVKAAKTVGVNAKGTVRPILDVQRDGKVQSVRFDPSSVNDVQLLKCLREAMAKLEFPPFEQKRPIKIQHSFAFEGTRLAFEDGYPKVEGIPGLTDEEKFEVYRAGSPKVRACYEKLLERTPGVGGRVGVRITVDPSGKVAGYQVKETGIHDPAFARCMEEAVRSWRFPKPRGRQTVPVHYPFIFQPVY